MLPNEFQLLELIQGRGLSDGTKTSKAAYDVLVKGHTQKAAAERHGMHAVTLNRKVQSVRKLREQILTVYKAPGV